MISVFKDYIFDLFENLESLKYIYQVLGILYKQIEDCIGKVKSNVNGYN